MMLARRWILALGLAGGLLVGTACAPAQPAPAKSPPAAGSTASAGGQASSGGAASAAPTMPPAPHTGVAEEAPLAVIPELRIARGADMVTLSPFNNFAVQDKYVLKHILA